MLDSPKPTGDAGVGTCGGVEIPDIDNCSSDTQLGYPRGSRPGISLDIATHPSSVRCGGHWPHGSSDLLSGASAEEIMHSSSVDAQNRLRARDRRSPADQTAPLCWSGGDYFSLRQCERDLQFVGSAHVHAFFAERGPGVSKDTIRRTYCSGRRVALANAVHPLRGGSRSAG